LSDT
jgi:hypothetical protein